MSFGLRRFYGNNYPTIEALIDLLEGYVSNNIIVVGSSGLPFGEVCEVGRLPVRVVAAEGLPGKRFFPQTEFIDRAEAMIDEGIRAVFPGVGDEYQVSGQPHSATTANHMVINAVLTNKNSTPKKVVVFSPGHGGHISHKFGVNEPHEVHFLPQEALNDTDVFARFVGKHKPSLIIVGGSSYPFGFEFESLASIADKVGAHLHADLAHMGPFVATGIHKPAFPHVGSATIDLGKNMRGKSGGILVFKRDIAKKVGRNVFPKIQSSPNRDGILAKAVCLAIWSKNLGGLKSYAERLVEVSKILVEELSPLVGEPAFGGTNSHLVTFDVSNVAESGKNAESILSEAGILINRNPVPNDPLPPYISSGIRLGSTVMVQLGYSDSDVRRLCEAIKMVLTGRPGHQEIVEGLVDRYNKPYMEQSGPEVDSSENPFPRSTPSPKSKSQVVVGSRFQQELAAELNLPLPMSI